VIVPGIFMGASVDIDANGQPDANAMGDDLDGTDDEDGVTFTSPLRPGWSATVNVVASVDGVLDAWLDYGGDGSWAAAGDRIFTAEPLVAGVNVLNLSVPGDAAPGQTFARFRFSTAGGLTYEGGADDGEVEDHVVTIEEEPVDWGDAPDPTYPTLALSNGASHAIVPGMFMGAVVDIDPDGQPDPNAQGDDNDGTDDEDGVALATVLFAGELTSFDVVVSMPGHLDAWLDFGGDGSWAEPGDQIFISQPLSPGVNSLFVQVPSGASLGQTFARFRYSTEGGLSYDGPAADGEVEDYALIIQEGEEYKWLQTPDLAPTGMDVRATAPYLLADDFLCTEPGRLTEIALWGSWLDDVVPDPTVVGFRLSIHEDIPDSVSPTGHSMPGEVLWYGTFTSLDYGAEIWADGLEEGWLDPPGDYTFPGDTVCWLYTFVIDPADAFHQVGTPEDPVVYWLDVQAVADEPGASFGWKTSNEHWNDDAVWTTGEEPYVGLWDELMYPPEHPFFPASIDLAFRIVSEYGTGVPEEGVIPEGYGLFQNVPNPFNPATEIAYDVPASGGRVTIEIFDVAGRHVATLVDGEETPGRKSVTWHGVDENGRDLPSGVYFCRLRAEGYDAARKMLLLK